MKGRLPRCITSILTAALLCLTALPGASRADGLTVYANAMKFANPAYDSLVRIDFPISVNRHEFLFSPIDPGSDELFARIFADVVLYTEDGLPVDSTSRLFLTRAKSHLEAEDEDVRVFNFLTLFARPGLYSARVTVIDADSKAKGEFFIERLRVTPPDRGAVKLSEVILAYDVRYVGRDSATNAMPQVRNGFFITPNPSRVFSEDDSTVHIYAEAYNLDQLASDSADWWISYAAHDDTGALFLGLGQRRLESPGASAVITDRLDVKGWPSGVYTIKVRLQDRLSGSSSSVDVPMRILSDAEIAAVAASAERRPESIPGDPYNRLTLEEKEQLITYLLTPEQKATLSQLSDRGKETFMSQFWRENDIDPTTPVIENRLQMIQRLEYANDRFSSNEARTNGWAEDRGRIYMTYGEPYQTKDFPSPMTGSPFVIWYYYLQDKGRYFIFIDRFSVGEYQLVHSNVYGEPYDKAWQEMVDEGVIEEMDREN